MEISGRYAALAAAAALAVLGILALVLGILNDFWGLFDSDADIDNFVIEIT